MGILFKDMNWIGVLLGTVAYFMLGALWYSPLFGKKWIAYNKIDMSNPNAKKGVGIIMLGSFVLQFVQCTAIGILALRLEDFGNSWMNGLKLGALTGACFGAATVGVNYLYEKKPLGLFLINGGYTTLGNIIAAIIICMMGNNL